MRHAHQLAAHADPDVARTVGQRGVEQRHVGPDRRHEQDRIVASANGLSMTRQSGRWRTRSEPSTPRSGMNGTPFSAACSPAWIAGQVESRISIAPALIAATNRGAAPCLAERHGGGLDALHAAGADQQIGLEAELRHADQMQIPGAAPDQRARTTASAQPE